MRGPEQIGGFIVEARLGEGGMGAVYRVVDPRTGARHALKVLTAPQDAEAVRRFVREGEALAAVGDHPNVVRVHAAGESNGRPYLLMQLCAGGDLKGRLRAGPLPVREAARIVADAARGLAYVHARGIVHRDLKPENVLFDDAGTTRVSDFGLARVGGAGSLTATGAILGTPAYMAPEQADGRRDVDARADVWGLGGLLIAALTGRPPYDGATAVNIFAKLFSESPRWPSVDRPDTPPALESIVRHAMARRPEDRYASAADLATDLERFLAGELDTAPSRRRTAVMLGAVALLLALVVSIAVLTQRPDEPAPLTPPPTPPTPPIAVVESARSVATPPAAKDWRTQPSATAPVRIEMDLAPAHVLFLDATRLVVAGANLALVFDADTGEQLADAQLVGGKMFVLAGGQLYASTYLGDVGRVQALTVVERALSVSAPLPPTFRDLASIACTSDGKVLVVLDSAGDLHAVSLASGDRLGRPVKGPGGSPPAMACVAVSPDGRHVACTCRGELRVLSLDANGLTLSRGEMIGSVSRVVFVSDQTIVVGTELGAIHLFDVDLPGELESTFEAHRSADADPFGLRPRALRGPVRGLAVSGPIVVGASGGSRPEQNEVRAWDQASGRALWSLPRPMPVVGVAFSPDGLRCAVSSRDADSGAIEVWKIEP